MLGEQHYAPVFGGFHLPEYQFWRVGCISFDSMFGCNFHNEFMSDFCEKDILNGNIEDVFHASQIRGFERNRFENMIF